MSKPKKFYITIDIECVARDKQEVLSNISVDGTIINSQVVKIEKLTKKEWEEVKDEWEEYV